MHTGKRYTPLEFLKWTLRDTLWLLLIAAVPTVLYACGLHFIALPWQPVAVLGTALAFIVGFKNNASYGRIWEARQIYGAVINNSRSFAYTLRDAVSGKGSAVARTMFLRHYAWLTALRYQLREPRSWENMQRRSNQEFLNDRYSIPEWETPLEDELGRYLFAEELRYILAKKNRATQLTALQSETLAALKRDGTINDFQWKELQGCLIRLTDDQGKAERIKNFPYPRNFASVTTYLLFIYRPAAVRAAEGVQRAGQRHLHGGLDRVVQHPLLGARGMGLPHPRHHRRKRGEPLRGQRQRHPHRADQ